jgi:hypothetical protein
MLTINMAGQVMSGATLTFDDINSLGEYAPLGVTFSQNASIWSGSGSPSVLDTPDGGPYSVPNGLQIGNAGGELGSIFFTSTVSFVSIWALSGPGGDFLNSPMFIKAFDASGKELGEASVNASLQFELLSISAEGIRRIDLFSPVPNNDVWDHLTFTSPTSVCKPVLSSIRCSQVEICWNSELNKIYQVQHRSSVSTSGWTDLVAPVAANGKEICIYDSIPVGEPKKFYQVLCFELSGGATNLVPVNPKATYLNADQNADAPTPVSLASLNIQPGDRLLLRQLGSFNFATQGEDQLSAMVGVFSTSATLLPRGILRRVPGAVSSGTPFLTALVDEVITTDIPEDFLINQSIITVPPGATHLFLSGHDVHYGDNSDPDGDYQLELVRLAR